MDTSGDSLLLGELLVGEEMIEESGGRGEGEEKVAKETRKPPIEKRYIKF